MIISGCFLVVVLWYFAVHQREAIVETRRSQLDAQLQEITEGHAAPLSSAQVQSMIDQMDEESGFYESHWRQSADSSSTYGLLDQIAADAQVSVVRIEPSKSGVQIRRQNSNVSVSGFSIEVKGSFPNVCDFIENVQLRTGMTRVDAVRIFPIGAQLEHRDQVTATIQTSHIAVDGVFEVSEATP